MGSDEERRKVFSGSWSLSAKLCDSCKSASALLFCRADSAFLCMDCDAKVHGANKLASRHERVWMCEVCEQAPASVTCKADAAALCVTCDADIHSANPLARRHERFPVVPFYEPAAAVVKSNSERLLVPDRLLKTTDEGDIVDDDQNNNKNNEDDLEQDSCREEAEAASWLLSNPNPKLMEAPEMKPADYFFSDVDPYLDLDYASSMDARFQQQKGAGADSVVPVQTKAHHPPIITQSSDQHCLDMDFYPSKPSYSYTTPSLSHSVSSSSLDVGVVPDGSNAMTDISNPFELNKSTIDLSSGSANPASSHLSGLDREARVLRYREKRKNRKFEKTIRYASRKAYAETRPRIKGRFAKRTEMESEVDRIYSSPAIMMADAGYGVVPSF